MLSSNLAIGKGEDDRYGDGEREKSCCAGLGEREKQMRGLCG